jgi:CheY-like chemotaxis protein
MTILLVEDDHDDQDIFKEAVAIVRSDITCLVAKDGEEGLAVLQSLTTPPHSIFLDINMPRMDGKEFLRAVKADPRLKHIPVVIYSTSNQKSELGEYFTMGASSFITKPSEFNLLVTYLKSVLGSRA